MISRKLVRTDLNLLVVLQILLEERNVTRAAEETGMQRSNFQALMAKYDIRIRGAHDKEE